MAACSLLLPNLIPSTPKALNPSPLHFPSIFSYSTTTAAAAALPSLRWKVRNLELSTAAKVAVSADYEQEQQSFSPDLKLFVGNLTFTVDSSELAGLFQDAGNVEMVEVIYDKITGRSRGFGFVTMSTVEEVEAAAQRFNGYEFKGRSLNVNSGPPPPKEGFPSRGFRSSSGGSSFGSGGSSFGRGGGSYGREGGSVDAANRVYVGNLSWDVDNNALETLFSEQGKVMDAKVVYDRETGRSRGFGFVTYSSAQEVNKAISSLDVSDLDGRNIRVSPAEARPPRREF